MLLSIDETTVAVDTYEDLKQALEGDAPYTLVYLAADIALTGPVVISSGKEAVTIDGGYSPDGVPVTRTLTEFRSNYAVDSFGLRAPSSIAITLQNINIVGHNYVGIPHIPPNPGYDQVVVTYRNVTYTGPQITFHPKGLTRYLDCRITSGAGHSSVQEIGEVGRVEIGGRTRIRHHSPQECAVFQFYENAGGQSLTILPGADVELRSEQSLFAGKVPISLRVREGARLELALRQPAGATDQDRLSSLTVEKKGNLRMIQEERAERPALLCSGEVLVEEMGRMYVQADWDGGAPRLQFAGNSTSLRLQDPASFALYGRGGEAVKLAPHTQVSLRVGQINGWLQGAPLAAAGTRADPPAHTWQDRQYTLVEIDAAADSTGALEVHRTSFTAWELAELPPLSSLRFCDFPVFSAGNLPVALDPVLDKGEPITGITAPGAEVGVYGSGNTQAICQGTADAEGRFAVTPAIPIPKGRLVTAVSSLPFLLSGVGSAVVREGGELALVSVPKVIPFLLEAISQNPALYGREPPELSVVFSDTRLHGGDWYLYGAVKEPLAGKTPGRPVPCDLVFVDQAGTVHPMSGEPLLVAAGKRDPSRREIQLTWPGNRGLLMRGTGKAFYSGEKYSATVTWTLSGAPLSDR